MPSQTPPAVVSGGVSVEGPVPTMAGIGDAAPSLPVIEGGVTAITAWQNNKQITALWSINQNRNAWVGVGGIGWKRLANNSDSAIVALTMLSAHAREKGSTVNYREESDGMIHEMYVW
jgi:poly(3-hydroxybutyrate) depolymerase